MHSEKLKNERMEALATIQAHMRELVPPNVSLVDELITERREEARREQEKYERRYDISPESEKP